MDMLDEVADMAGIGPDLLIELRRRFGGQSHYICSARPLVQDQIRRSTLPAADLARRYGVTRKTVARIKAR